MITLNHIPDSTSTNHNNSTTNCITLLFSEENFKKLFDMIQDKGYGGIMLYFTATLKKTSDLHINISETHPETW